MVRNRMRASPFQLHQRLQARSLSPAIRSGSLGIKIGMGRSLGAGHQPRGFQSAGAPSLLSPSFGLSAGYPLAPQWTHVSALDHSTSPQTRHSIFSPSPARSFAGAPHAEQAEASSVSCVWQTLQVLKSYLPSSRS